jgi:hypothetical protein
MRFLRTYSRISESESGSHFVPKVVTAFLRTLTQAPTSPATNKKPRPRLDAAIWLDHAVI